MSFRLSLKGCRFQANLLAFYVKKNFYFNNFYGPYLKIWAVPLLTKDLRAICLTSIFLNN